MLAFPTFFLILAVIAILEQSIFTIMVIRYRIDKLDGCSKGLLELNFSLLKEKDFVSAARAVGASDKSIFRHILPNALSPVLLLLHLGLLELYSLNQAYPSSGSECSLQNQKLGKYLDSEGKII
jgi:peptide/nickel transport system permease protein